MKGKGKGERSSGGSASTTDSKECPLQYPDLSPVEHTAECPRYTSVVKRTDEDSIGLEEVDGLQTDLETLLASVAKRMRLLEAQIQILVVWLEKGKVDKKSLPAAVAAVTAAAVASAAATPLASISSSKTQEEPSTGGSAKRGGRSGDEKSSKKTQPPQSEPSPGGKRGGKGSEDKDKPSKKMKDNSGRAVAVSTSGKHTSSDKPVKGKVQTLKLQEYEFPESPSSKPKTTGPKTKELPKLPKNDTPNRFWAMVEPYCQEVTTEDLKVLEDILKTHEDDAEYYKVPSLGKHYSHKWAHDDLSEEQKEGKRGRLNERRKSGSGGGNSSEAAALLRRMEDSDDETSPFGPLTQRLVQALMEENIMTPIDDTTISEADAVEAATISPRSLAKQLNLGNTAALERRIKRELEEHGILEAEDNNKPEDDPNDEILAELKKKQQELKVISQHNLTITKRLIKMAKEEMQRQELRKKMAAADADVMDAYRRIQASRQKKKTPTKKKKVPTATLR